ncbi:MAG: ABC transporter permease [Hymenobacteraceae bacterium]|nr:ABC transporter permease [Hymenobacteraceae bacterium]MDX5394635.1 ABC transporter permease [Hymenobacteraceae bacterium]MDX5510666.1 ABC transporter permease [Hymenobacteraceae bacterium]
MSSASVLLRSKWNEKAAAGWLLLVLLLALTADVIPLPYSPEFIDAAHVYQAPASGPHLFGTDQLGRDVLANIIYGCRIALLISIPVMVLVTILGVAAGTVAGYYGNKGIRVSRAGIFCWILFLGGAAFYSLYLQQFKIQAAFTVGGVELLLLIVKLAGITALVGVGSFLVYKALLQLPLAKKQHSFPADSVVLGFTELTASLPQLVLLLAVASFTSASVAAVLIVIFVTAWAVPARLVRAEVLKVKQQHFVEAAVVLGLPTFKIIVKHILPNALVPVFVAFAYGVAGLIAMEATLSFLGIGIPADVPSWGRLIKGARANMEAWWLLALPGFMLIFTVLAIHIVTQWLKNRITGVKSV